MKNSKSFWLKTGAATGMALIAACFVLSVQAADKKILVVSVTKGFVHDVIPEVNDLVAKLAKDSGQFDVTFVKTDEDMAKYMTMESLQKYDGVFFNNTTGNLPLPDAQGFINWIASGKGYVGVHAATDTFGGFPPYTEMVGGLFLTHRNQSTITPIIEDPTHPILEGFPADLAVHDEIYILQKFHRETVHGLLTLDNRPNDGSEDANQPGDYAIAYCKNWGQGRVFYTSLGHR
ncbi:MAG: ThuA domain-containing protein, partial [Verrucomicrobia bacterium]|nr:ThuA domain-containing protein [Verrucomicrobiota bacterium]